MKKLFALGAAAGLLFFASGSYAGVHPERWEFRAGYGYQYKDTKSRPHNFQLLNFMASTAVPMGEQRRSGWFKGRLEWAPEFWLGLFTHPYDRPLIGAIPLQFRYLFQPEWKPRPYLFAGAGILYANVNRKETQKDLNFNLQVGAGFYYALSETASLILEYRHVHLSNAGLHESNSGMNTHTFLAGVSFRR